MAKTVDALDLKSDAEKHPGSNPGQGTTIIVDPLVLLVRLYNGQAKYYDPYVGILYLQVIGKDGLYIGGLHGTITRQHYKELVQYAIDNGYTHFYAERHGQLIRKEIKKAPKEGL